MASPCHHPLNVLLAHKGQLTAASKMLVPMPILLPTPTARFHGQHMAPCARLQYHGLRMSDDGSSMVSSRDRSSALRDTNSDESPWLPGDVVCDDDDECMLMVATDSDGIVDEAIPLDAALPLQQLAQRVVASPAFEFLSVSATAVLLYTFSVEFSTLEFSTLRPFFGAPPTTLRDSVADELCSALVVLEFIVRAWAVGFQRRYLVRPLTVLDFFTALPILVEGPLAEFLAPLLPLRLLRSFRILRLRRLLEAKEVLACDGRMA